MHVVTYSDWFSNIGEAQTNTRGLAVVAAFFEVKLSLFSIYIYVSQLLAKR